MRTKSPTYENITNTGKTQVFLCFRRIDYVSQIFSFLQHFEKTYEKERRHEQKPPTCPGSLPRCPQDVPRPPKDLPRRPKMAPRWRQDLPKRSSDDSKTPPDAPKMYPRCIQDDLRTPKTSTKAPQEPPRPSRDAPDPPSQKHPFGVNFNDNFNLVGFSLLALPHAFEAEKLPRSPTGSLPSIDFIDSTVLLIASQISLEPCSPVVTFVSFR